MNAPEYANQTVQQLRASAETLRSIAQWQDEAADFIEAERKRIGALSALLDRAHESNPSTA